MAQRESHKLPLRLGLCPVHYEEFYYPLRPDEQVPVTCPEDCREELVIYEMVAAERLERPVVWLDGGPEVLSWLQAHRHHKDEPYRFCPFCEGEFVPKGSDGVG
jgi:hypothetical protein